MAEPEEVKPEVTDEDVEVVAHGADEQFGDCTYNNSSL